MKARARSGRKVADGFRGASGFTPKQLTALDTVTRHGYTLYGGSRGPGKSYFLRWTGAYLLSKYRKLGISFPVVGLFCEDYPVLRDRQIGRIGIELARWGEVKTTQEWGLGWYPYAGGLMALRNLDDPSKYQSAEFAAVLVDELTRNKEGVFHLLRGSLRWPGLPPEWIKFVAATNPGGPGHLWVKALWLDGIFPPELESYRDQFAFVPALPDDNPFLPPEYWKMLESLPHDLARAWRWGDWDVFEGQAFGEWRKHLHVVEPFEIPSNWFRWRAVDWGFARAFCCLWLARDPDTWRTVVYRELYGAGLTDPEQAEKIASLTGEGENILITLADPSMWTKKSIARQVLTSADVYNLHGVPLRPGENDRLIGKRRVHDALAMMDDGKPGLLVFENCKNLVRTLPALTYDQTNVEDVDTDGEDHAYDALRYGLSYKVRARREPEEGGDYWASVRHGSAANLTQAIEVWDTRGLEDG